MQLRDFLKQHLGWTDEDVHEFEIRICGTPKQNYYAAISVHKEQQRELINPTIQPLRDGE